MNKTYEELSEERKELQSRGWLPEWYTTPAWQIFSKKYIYDGEPAFFGRCKQIAATLSRHMKGQEPIWEKKFFDLIWQGILSPASPALSNTGTTRGMPVSCSGQFVGDSIDSFYSNLREAALLSKEGFGTSADFSSIRPRGASISKGGKANGVSDVVDDFFTCSAKVSQGGNRRGSFAAFVNIDHPDWDELVDKLLTEPNGKNYGWTLTDDFCNRLKQGDTEANRRYSKALYAKMVSGKGYFFFVDKANRHRPPMYVKNGLDIKATNLCTEIMLHSSEEYSYTCVLSSLNLLHWDKIKDSDAAFTATVFLDCLCSEFIERGRYIPGLEKAVAFTEAGRAIGLGALGFHSYLQSQKIPYESFQAHMLSTQIAHHIHEQSEKASRWLAKEYGVPDWCRGFGLRNTHRTAYAPTKTTSQLMGGASESWFPEPGMVYEAESAAGSIRRISPIFYQCMKEKGVYNKDTIQDIAEHLGSVQHVSWLNHDEKLLFRNAFEMNQEVLFNQAMARQRYVCQGQSLNFYVPENGSEDLIAKLMSKVVDHPSCLSQYYIYSRSGVTVSDECIACAA